jgi:hypothetical protein
VRFREPPRGIARVLYSPKERFRTVVLAPRESKYFGRDERADVRIADGALLGVHFRLFFDGTRFDCMGVGGAELAVNGRPARYGMIDSGGFLVAGETTFSLFSEERSAPAPRADVMTALGPARDAGTLYALVDGARDDRVLHVLQRSIDAQESLYEGREGAAFDDIAPYLVKLDASSLLLERLVAEGWGQGWASYFVSREPFKMVRRHFRRFLMVRDVAGAQRLYFRFYDPRVLREFLPIATPRQRQELFGSLSRDDGAEEDARRSPLRGVPDAGYVIDEMLYESSAGEVVRAPRTSEAQLAAHP